MRFITRTVVTAAPVLLAACSGLTDVTGTSSLPSGVVDPKTYQSPDGALGMYRKTVTQFQDAFMRVLQSGGLLTDELTTTVRGGPLESQPALDTRRLAEDSYYSTSGAFVSDQMYGALQLVRTYGVQAAGALTKYNPGAPVALHGHIDALEGYAEVYLADVFCSGVPLSELEFEGDFVYKPGSSTAEIYARAVAHFDSALALAGDSARVRDLARVGKGRALLALGQYAAAAQAVAQVPDTFQYQFPVAWAVAANSLAPGTPMIFSTFVNVADREGINGLPYRSGGDPRTAVDSGPFGPNGGDFYYVPVKYGRPTRSLPNGSFGATSSVTVASGIEARLIQAEAQLHADSATGGTTWLATLNRLRATATVPGMTGPLPALENPATWAERVDLLFAERAAWLFVDAHRQGDLRRLIRHYGRPQSRVYPTGAYMGSAAYIYGSDVNVPIPVSEHPNPYFHGCLSRRA